MQNLTLLCLSGCKEITDKGLIKGVAKLPKLRELDVRYCPLITNRGLLKSVVKLSELRRLHLSQFRHGQSVQNIIDSHAEHYVQKIISIFDECGLFPKALNSLIMNYIEYFLSSPLVIVK